MATVYVGSARVDENGHAHGGAAGDQTGKELSTQKWYDHTKGWRVLRAKSYAIADKIAEAMQAACDNGHIGYDQYQRDTLLNVAAKVNPAYHPGKVTTACETDCSALVRVCTAYAVGRDVIGEVLNGARFSTANQVTQMLKTGLFDELVGTQYTKQSAYLRRGDILVTKTQGHTVVVLNSGDKAGVTFELGDRVLRKVSPYMQGDDVKEMQSRLNAAGYDCGEVDGSFGSNTEKGVKAFQSAAKIEVNGKFDAIALTALMAMEGVQQKKYVYITGATVNVRKGAGTANELAGKPVHEGDTFEYTETADVDGRTWYHIEKGWVSGKYAQEIELGSHE